ncbi:MAG TPA: PfkB family carbohydrate kinase [Thermoleophilaceae bacterium]|nr:PfkB family carbohydrate kinase [Thermoleophilaceae bacterium]
MRTAVVGHVEWVEFARVPRVPAAGEITFARESWEEPAGGGSVSAVQLAKLAGGCDFFTAVGGDDLGRRAVAALERLGLRVHAAVCDDAPTRRGFTFVDDAGERTITVIGDKLLPRGSHTLPWARLSEADACFFIAGDAGAATAARAARVLTASSREIPVLREAAVRLDALIGSGTDPGERYEDGYLDPPPRLVVRTDGAAGGSWAAEERTGSWAAAEVRGPVADAYGCGDSFAAGLTYALGRGDALEDALALAARCGAACLTGRGPYARQLVESGS